jgi:TolA-binding protein
VRLPLAAAALAAGLAAAGPVRAQVDSREAIALQNQILELRRDLQGLQAQRGAPALAPPVRRGGDGGGSDIAAQLLDRVIQLEDDVRRLRGQVDEQANTSRRQHDDLAKQIADLNFRLQNPNAAPTAPSALPTGPISSGRRPPELAMQEGNAALARRDYAAAEAAAREVLAGGRNATRAGDAQFLLAQALMGKRDYAGAAVAYDDAYNRSRNGSRAPDALLGLANALAGLNDRANACAALDRLRAEFPSPRANVREAAAAARGRSGCP